MERELIVVIIGTGVGIVAILGTTLGFMIKELGNVKQEVHWRGERLARLEMKIDNLGAKIDAMNAKIDINTAKLDAKKDASEDAIAEMKRVKGV